jgi:hypothetical protein
LTFGLELGWLDCFPSMATPISLSNLIQLPRLSGAAKSVLQQGSGEGRAGIGQGPADGQD